MHLNAHTHTRTHTHSHVNTQDAEVGDGTTSVVLLAAEVLKQVKVFVEDGLHPQVLHTCTINTQTLTHTHTDHHPRPACVSRSSSPSPTRHNTHIHVHLNTNAHTLTHTQIIIRGLRQSLELAVARLRELSVVTEGTGPEVCVCV